MKEYLEKEQVIDILCEECIMCKKPICTKCKIADKQTKIEMLDVRLLEDKK